MERRLTRCKSSQQIEAERAKVLAALDDTDRALARAQVEFHRRRSSELLSAIATGEVHTKQVRAELVESLTEATRPLRTAPLSRGGSFAALNRRASSVLSRASSLVIFPATTAGCLLVL